MRNINSAGVQITEIDKSDYAVPSVGTSVFVAGFAPQGPIDEIQRITTLSEFENTYGTPKTAAEVYFYETSKQILQSNGSLICTRLPYGEGDGDGFVNQYTALLYPATSALDISYNRIETVTVQSVRLHDDEGIEGVDFAHGIDVTTFQIVTSGLKVKGVDSTIQAAPYESDPNLDGWSTLSLSTIKTEYVDVFGNVLLNIGIPRQITLNVEQYQAIKNGQFDWDENLYNTNAAPEPQWLNYADNGVDVNFMRNVGFIVLNKSKTTNNDAGEGYYINIADNSNWGPEAYYNSVESLKALSANNAYQGDSDVEGLPVSYGYVDIPSSRFTTALSSNNPTEDSISHNIEKLAKYNFGNSYYTDSIVFTVARVSQSIYQPNLLQAQLVEGFLGSFDNNKKVVADSGGIQRAFFIEDVVSNNSSRIQLLVNPRISKSIAWTDPTSTTPNPVISLRVLDEARCLFAAGVYESSALRSYEKNVGNVPVKLEHALRLVENVDQYTVDIVVDAGLSTIHCNQDSNGSYNDTKRLPGTLLNLTTPDADVIVSWRQIYNTLDTFASITRKDCVAIVDPLRQVFLHGNTKLSERKTLTFTQSIYTPLKNLFSGCDSNFTAGYGNWGLVDNAYVDRKVWVPLSGAVAAVYANSDATNYPWYAPAGFSRGVLNGVIDIACNTTQKQRDNLYTISVNPIVFFPGDGFVVFGQKTLQQKPTAFDRVNVRRLFVTLERATYRAMKRFVFEPNTYITRSRIVGTLSPIFEQAKRTQGVYDYMIVCDERNNTGDTIDRNELIIDIYIKPVKAAEFILVNFIATRTGQSFSELM